MATQKAKKSYLNSQPTMDLRVTVFLLACVIAVISSQRVEKKDEKRVEEGSKKPVNISTVTTDRVKSSSVESSTVRGASSSKKNKKRKSSAIKKPSKKLQKLPYCKPGAQNRPIDCRPRPVPTWKS